MSVLARNGILDANILYLYPGQTMENACEVILASSTSKTTSATITMKSEYLNKEVKSKEKAIGLNQDTAPLSGMQYSPFEGVTAQVGKDERWYKFNVSDRAVSIQRLSWLKKKEAVILVLTILIFEM